MAEVAEDYDPKYEFLAPKYVNLLEAASEAALYDGADEWFDQLRSNNDLVQEYSTTEPQVYSKVEATSVDTQNQLEKYNGYSTPSQIDLYSDSYVDLHIEEANKPDKENIGDKLNTRESFKTNQENHSKTQEKRISSVSRENTACNHSKEPGNPQYYKLVTEENIGVSNTEESRKSKQSTLKAQQNPKLGNITHLEKHLYSRKSQQHLEHSTQNSSNTPEKRFIGPPTFRTEQRAFLHKERRKSSTDINPKVNEPRTPKNFGASWKPSITIPHTPKFHSERRLRHCVERATQQEPKAKMKQVKVVRDDGNITLTVPESPTFRTQKRAESYRALKGVPLTYEEEELQKIQAERNALRKLLQSGKQMWAKAINFQEFKAKKEKIQRIATIPRAFTFATQERSVQRSSNTLKATDSNIVEPVSSTWNKSNDSQHSSLVQDRKMPRVQRPNPAVQRTSDQLQTSTKTRATENQKRKDSPTTRGPRESIPSKQKGSSLDAPKIDVFTRLYQSGNRRSQQTSLHSNKLHPKAQSETRQPVIFNTRSLPQLRSVSNFKSTKNKPREDKRQVEQSTSLPQYAFRSNSPIHNKCRRASRVPIAENEQVVELV